MKKKFLTFLETKGISEADYKTKTAEETAELYNEFNDEQRKEIDALIENKATKEDIANAVDALRNSQLEQMKTLNSAMSEMGLSIKAFTDKSKDSAPKKSLIESIKDGLKANAAKLTASKEGNKSEAKDNEFSFKAAGDMLISTNISGGNVPVEQRLSGVNMIPTRRIRLMDLVSRGTATSNVISWVYQANQDGAAGYTAEGVAKNQIDFDLVVASETVQKITAYIKISTEMLDDIDFMDSLIRTELLKELLKTIESQVYAGAGGGAALNGIRTTATAFAAGSFALSIDNANEVDVLTVASNQILLAEHDQATAILMNPSDVTALKMVKVSSTDKRYVERLAMVAGALSLDGIPIIETTLVTVGEYLIGDFPLSLVLDKGGVNIDIGLDGNDFTKNMRTVLAEWRGVVITKNNDRTAFVKGVFATDQAALETA
jgi:HK97 family phage major capsid protein